MPLDFTRRSFIKKSAQAAGALGALGALASAQAEETAPRPAPKIKTVSPNEKIVMGWIGCGDRGQALMKNFKAQPDVEIAACCDHRRQSRRLQRLPQAPRPKGHRRCHNCDT
jgi:anaerobic selenocysteine-containing dehydrogenase